MNLYVCFSDGDDDAQPSTSGYSSSRGQSGAKADATSVPAPSSASTDTPPNLADLRAKRAAFLDRLQNPKQDGKDSEETK